MFRAPAGSRTVGVAVCAPQTGALASVSAREKAAKGANAPSFHASRGQFDSAFLRAGGEFHVMRASEPFLMEVDDEILLQTPCRAHE